MNEKKADIKNKETMKSAERPDMPQLNLPPQRLRVQRRGDEWYVWDNVREGWFVLTPEEWVRRHIVGFLVDFYDVPLKRIVQEYPVNVNSQPQRADVVVLDAAGRPYILVECKEYNESVAGVAWAQAVRYNAVLKARYVILTNGRKTLCRELTPEGYRVVQRLDTEGLYR